MTHNRRAFQYGYQKTILLITTGGTIASVPGGEGLEPRRSDVLEREINQLRTYYDVTVQDLMCLDSSNIQAEDWSTIARAVFQARGTLRRHRRVPWHRHHGLYCLHGFVYAGKYRSAGGIHRFPAASGGLLSDAPANLRTAFAMAATGHPGVFLPSTAR